MPGIGTSPGLRQYAAPLVTCDNMPQSYFPPSMLEGAAGSRLYDPWRRATMSAGEKFPVPSLANESFVEVVSHPDPASISRPAVMPNPLGNRAEQLNTDWVLHFL